MTSSDREYQLIIARRFLKDLKKLSREDQLRVRRTLPKLKDKPYQGRKVSAAETGQYRWRIGNLRIRYDIERDQIHILRVIKREDAYRKL
jgi:mRNA-degrading endonuclease RelE of RelBE toxin-antitoxin system